MEEIDRLYEFIKAWNKLWKLKPLIPVLYFLYRALIRITGEGVFSSAVNRRADPEEDQGSGTHEFVNAMYFCLCVCTGSLSGRNTHFKLPVYVGAPWGELLDPHIYNCNFIFEITWEYAFHVLRETL